MKPTRPAPAFLQKCARHCAGPGTLTDQRGNRWCEACTHRYELMQVGCTYDFPELSCPPYAIAAGYEFWMTAALIGTDDYIQRALQVIHALQSEVA